MNELFDILITLGVVLSFLSSMFLMLTHYTVKKMMKHPGPIVICLCISQIVLDLNWITGIPGVLTFLLGFDDCFTLGALGVFAYSYTWGYITVLSLEIMYKILHPASKSYKKRVMFFHLSVFIYSLAIILIISFQDNFGESSFKTCFIKQGSSAE